MTAALAMRAHAPHVSRVEAQDDVMARIRAAIQRAPVGPPLSEEERARIASNRARGYPGTSGEDFMAQVAALPDDEPPDAEE